MCRDLYLELHSADCLSSTTVHYGLSREYRSSTLVRPRPTPRLETTLHSVCVTTGQLIGSYNGVVPVLDIAADCRTVTVVTTRHPV
ncbi:hypothetical protein RRG08_051179 [Elysia crispata]|uniref:Uncharacterized protein n=1 Tax=Elysia crispata TaxID=231223 RepID=A0AAE0Z6F7_9GAST|nr:hypothetical protein RRG08_051179 [Elysia crispata]